MRTVQVTRVEGALYVQGLYNRIVSVSIDPDLYTAAHVVLGLIKRSDARRAKRSSDLTASVIEWYNMPAGWDPPKER